jgi:branched-chain amino acid transport system substrate-binding protein
MRGRTLLLLLAAVVLALLVGCGGAGGGREGGGEEGSTAKIVSDFPRQGANRFQTTTMVNAIKLARPLQHLRRPDQAGR